MSARPSLDENAKFSVETGLYVVDAKASLGFYCDTVGFNVFGEIFLPYAHVWGLEFGNSLLKVVQFDEDIEDRNPPGRAIGYRYVTVHVRDVLEAVGCCEAAGYTVVGPPSRLEPIPGRSDGVDCVSAFVLDPDENRVEFCQGSPWVLPARGGTTT